MSLQYLAFVILTAYGMWHFNPFRGHLAPPWGTITSSVCSHNQSPSSLNHKHTLHTSSSTITTTTLSWGANYVTVFLLINYAPTLKAPCSFGQINDILIIVAVWGAPWVWEICMCVCCKCAKYCISNLRLVERCEKHTKGGQRVYCKVYTHTHTHTHTYTYIYQLDIYMYMCVCMISW